jgi:uncharacterized protein DUF397
MNDDVGWRKSSYSGQGANCLEVAPVREGTAVRDSKNPGSAMLRFPEDSWRAFLVAVKSGRICA